MNHDNNFLLPILEEFPKQDIITPSIFNNNCNIQNLDSESFRDISENDKAALSIGNNSYEKNKPKDIKFENRKLISPKTLKKLLSSNNSNSNKCKENINSHSNCSNVAQYISPTHSSVINKRRKLNNGTLRNVLTSPSNNNQAADPYILIEKEQNLKDIARNIMMNPDIFSPINEVDEFLANSYFASDEKSRFHLAKSETTTQLRPIKRKFDAIICLSPSSITKNQQSKSSQSRSELKSLRISTNQYFTRESSEDFGCSQKLSQNILMKSYVPKSPYSLRRTKDRVRNHIISSEKKEFLQINDCLVTQFKNRTVSKEKMGSRSTHNKVGGNSIEKKYATSIKSNKKSWTKQPTVFVPFNLETGKRTLNSSNIPVSSVDSQIIDFKAKPIPNYVPFEVKKSTKPCIIPEGFELETEERAKRREELKKAEINRKEEIDINMNIRNFRALPIPDYSKLAKEHLNHHLEQFKSTTPLDIKLLTAERCNLRSLSKEESIDIILPTNFKAIPMPDFSNPFIPKLGNTELTEVEPFMLFTEKRSVNRAEFEQYLKEKESQKDEEEKRKEKEELELLRKQMKFKSSSLKSSLISLKRPSVQEIEQKNDNLCKENYNSDIHHSLETENKPN